MHRGVEDGVGVATVGLTVAAIDISVLVDVARVRVGGVQPTRGVLDAKFKDNTEPGRAKSIELSLGGCDIGRVGHTLVWVKILPANADDFDSDASSAFVSEVRSIVLDQAPEI